MSEPTEAIIAGTVPSEAEWLLVVGNHAPPDGWTTRLDSAAGWTLLGRGIAPYLGSAYDLTDENWTNGISNTGPVFFVAADEDARSAMIKGRSITFSDGERRWIMRSDVAGPYLNVVVSGGALPASAGYPQTFEVGHPW